MGNQNGCRKPQSVITSCPLRRNAKNGEVRELRGKWARPPFFLPIPKNSDQSTHRLRIRVASVHVVRSEQSDWPHESPMATNSSSSIMTIREEGQSKTLDFPLGIKNRSQSSQSRTAYLWGLNARDMSVDPHFQFSDMQQRNGRNSLGSFGIHFSRLLQIG